MMFLDRAIVIDDETHRIHLLARREFDDPESRAATKAWFDDIRGRIEAVPTDEADEASRRTDDPTDLTTDDPSDPDQRSATSARSNTTTHTE